MRPSWDVDVLGPSGSLDVLPGASGGVSVQPAPVGVDLALFGFEAGEGWGGGTAETVLMYEGAQSRRLAASPGSQLATFKAYPITPPVDLSMASNFTVQTMLRNGSPGFWSANLNVLVREGVTFNTRTFNFPLAFNYQDGLDVWIKRSVAVDWFGFDPTNIVEIIWQLQPISFGGGLAYIDDWRATS